MNENPILEQLKREALYIKTEYIVNSELWRLFPTINIDRVKDIPSDYPGLMGVPITFLDKYDTEQFEVVGITQNGARLENGKVPYRRILIRHLHPDLPEEIDFAEWLRRCGVGLEIQLMEIMLHHEGFRADLHIWKPGSGS